MPWKPAPEASWNTFFKAVRCLLPGSAVSPADSRHEMLRNPPLSALAYRQHHHAREDICKVMMPQAPLDADDELTELRFA